MGEHGVEHGGEDGAERKVRVHDPKDVAVGMPAVASSMHYALAEMGPVRTARTLLRMNHVSGFDCPSCAWPDPDRRSPAEFCENGAKAVAWEATRKRVGADFFAEHSLADLRGQDAHWLEHHGRLTEPMYLAAGATHFTPISWDDALRLVADRLRAMPDPNRAVFYTSGRASNEAAFAYQLLARRLGTNNLPDCSNMCHESSGAALTETLGVGKGTVTFDDIAEHAELIVIVGQNPGTNHPRMLTALEHAKRRGARIVGVNPLPEAGLLRFKNPQRPRGIVGRGTDLADRFLHVRVNGDLAFFAGACKRLVELEDASPGSTLDREFIDDYCTGLDDVLAHWRGLEWADIERHSGLTRTEIGEFVVDVVNTDKVVVCWAMGLTQHRNAVATIREIANFLLLRGNMGKPGAGAAPIRGHSNVQGDRTVGIWEKMSDEFLDKLRDEFGFDPPREHGTDSVNAIRAMRDGKVDVYVGLGGNLVSAVSDTEVAEAAMCSVPLTVHIATKLNRTHLCTGGEALLLPCLGRTERDTRGAGDQFVTVEDSMSMVHASRGHLKPGSPHLRSEVAIITGLGHALFGDDIGWQSMGEDYSLIRTHIEKVVPGFDDYERRSQHHGGFQLPNGARDRAFTTPDGKAHFVVNEMTSVQVPDGHLLLQTVRSHDQFNTTIYGMNDRYRGINNGRDVVFVHRDDLAERGLAEGDRVDLVSTAPDRERRLANLRAVEYPTARGCVAAYFPEANVLVPLDSVAEGSNTPTSKSVPVRLERHVS
jgi:molybdopterin-dependent oxidoreductase alpha subunit